MLTKVGYAEIWPLFGSVNQLLSVLALVACAVFLKKTKRQGCMFWIPMAFMMAVTFTALGMTGSWKHLTACICSITADSWCAGSNPGCEETA